MRKQASQGERSARGQLDRRLGLALFERRNGNVGQHNRAVVRQLANLDLDLEANAALRQNDGGEGDANTKFFEGDAHLSKGIDHGDRKLAASKEFCRLARTDINQRSLYPLR